MNPYKEFDSGDMYLVLKDYHEQVKHIINSKIEIEKKLYSSINKIVVTGLGGSAISGDVVYTLFYDQITVPYFVNRNYDLPNFIDDKTLVIACSYSGNTEETLSAFHNAISKNCKVITLSSGGKLKDMANELGVPHFSVPSGYQPRCAIGLMLTTLIRIFEKLELYRLSEDFYSEVLNLWSRKSNEYAHAESKPYDLATRLLGRFPVIHSTELLQSINVRFRSQLAENSKVLSYSGFIPELNHNEIIAWEKYDEKFLPAILIQIIDENDHQRNKLRFSITREILSEVKLENIVLQSTEKSYHLRIFDLIYFVDWVSFYLAVMRKIDPTPIKNINVLKETLSKN